MTTSSSDWCFISAERQQLWYHVGALLVGHSHSSNPSCSTLDLHCRSPILGCEPAGSFWAYEIWGAHMQTCWLIKISLTYLPPTIQNSNHAVSEDNLLPAQEVPASCHRGGALDIGGPPSSARERTDVRFRVLNLQGWQRLQTATTMLRLCSLKTPSKPRVSFTVFPSLAPGKEKVGKRKRKNTLAAVTKQHAAPALTQPQKGERSSVKNEPGAEGD